MAFGVPVDAAPGGGVKCWGGPGPYDNPCMYPAWLFCGVLTRLPWSECDGEICKGKFCAAGEKEFGDAVCILCDTPCGLNCWFCSKGDGVALEEPPGCRCWYGVGAGKC